MSSFTHPTYKVPIALPNGLTQAQVLNFAPFANWLAKLENSLRNQAKPGHPFRAEPYTLNNITVQAFDMFGPRIGFLKVAASITNRKKEMLPGAAFLRGPSVAMLVILIPEDKVVPAAGAGSARPSSAQGQARSSPAQARPAPAAPEEKYCLLTVQPRVPAGSLDFVELPAGMMDGSGNFAGTAAKEIREELGMEIKASQLKNMSELAGQMAAAHAAHHHHTGSAPQLPNAVYPSAGGCDEYMPIFVHERRVPRASLAQWQGKLTGVREEGENITLKLIRFDNLWLEGARDAKCLAAAALYNGLKRAKKL